MLTPAAAEYCLAACFTIKLIILQKKSSALDTSGISKEEGATEEVEMGLESGGKVPHMAHSTIVSVPEITTPRGKAGGPKKLLALLVISAIPLIKTF